MNIKFSCPYCNEALDAELQGECEVRCPACKQTFIVPGSIINEQLDDRLLDPSDPAGYFNNFPTEDDFE